MKLDSARLPALDDPDIFRVFKALGHQLRFIGGCVRNALIGAPIKDIDLATPLTPDVVTQKLTAIKIKVVPTGIRFGTVTAVVNKKPIEITTLRKDIDCYGRHAKVVFSKDWAEDAARRDFTVNALSCDHDGILYDYFDGLADLERGRLRFIGNAEDRCREDYLRILRFFRFHAFYGKAPIDPEGLAASTKLASHMEELSGERIRSEMLRLLESQDPTEVLTIMREHRISDPLLPVPEQLNALTKTKDPVRRIALMLRQHADPEVALHHLSKRWKLSNILRRRLNAMVAPEFSFAGATEQLQCQAVIRKLGKLLAQDMSEVEHAEGIISPEIVSLINSLLENWVPPVFPLTGKDLLAEGYPKDKTLGQALSRAEQWWEEKEYKPGKKELLVFLKESSQFD